VLHRMLSDHSVRLLAVTYDNGFLSPYARDNVDAIVKASGVEHRLHRPDWEALRAFYRATLLRLGDPCIACAIGGYALAIKASAEHGVPFFVHGRSPMQMFRAAYRGSRDPGLVTVRRNLRGYNPRALRWSYRALGLKFRALLRAIEPDRSMRRRIFEEFFHVPLSRQDVVPEFLAYFLFEPYDEEEIKSFLEAQHTGYRRPALDVPLGHADCLIHDVCSYLYRLRYGVSKVSYEVATMRRSGQLSAEEAEEIVRRDAPSEELVEESVGTLLDALDLPRAEFDQLTSRLARAGTAHRLA